MSLFLSRSLLPLALIPLIGAMLLVSNRTPSTDFDRGGPLAPPPAAETPSKPWRFSPVTGNELAIDIAKTGQISHWSIGGKTLVDAAPSPASPLCLTLADIETPALFSVTSCEEKKTSHGEIELHLKGTLACDAFALPARLRYEISPDASRIAVALSVSPPLAPDGSASASIRSFRWSLPCALTPRKKVYFRGEHGLDWETRYFYQFFSRGTGLASSPDSSEWRWFSLDQLGPASFRLWKSESHSTSPLVMQQGRTIPPYLQVFDSAAGITLEYPMLSNGTPKSLRVDASGGATLEVALWSETLPAGSLHLPGLLDTEHRFLLVGAGSETALTDARSALNARYPDAPPPEAAARLEEPEWLRTDSPPRHAPHYVTGGYPFARGEVADAARIAVAVDGARVPTQAKTLAYWPDGTIKWALLTFPVDEAKAAVAECPAPRVTLRNGKSLALKITAGPETGPNVAPPSGGTTTPLVVSHADDGSVSIVNGSFVVTLAPGSAWLAASRDGKSLLRPAPDSRLAYADYRLDPTPPLPFSRTPEGGTPDHGVLSVDKLEVEESGPLRAVVRLEGMVANREPTRVILRVEALAGRPELRVMHTAEFLFSDPRRTFLTGLGLELPLEGFDVEKAQLGVSHDGAPGVELFQETSCSRLLRPDWKTADTRRQAAGHGGWVQIAEKEGDLRFLGFIRHFRETAPKAVSIAPEGGRVRFELWPRSAGPMDVRRYSNRPHAVQGESVSNDPDWVMNEYYPQEPFLGISRSHEMLFGFWPASSAPPAEAVAADFESPPLLYAGWERYVSTGVILPAASSQEWPRAWEAWTNFARFWHYHRTLHDWSGFWDFGDLRHLFQTGYGWILPPALAAEALRSPLPPATLDKAKRLDYRPPNDWAFDNGRWGWTNTEAIPNLFLQHEYLRHGNRAVYFAAEALARFSRDVVIRHEGRWFGRGTRHGVQHWSDGNHEERQTTSTEYRLHYYLSGDGRTRDVANKLYERHYSRTSLANEAQHSGRWGGLLFHWEMTNAPEEATQLRTYAHSFIAPTGLYLAPPLRFPGPVPNGPPASLNGSSFFFNTFGAMHNLLEYQQMTGDPSLKAALIKMADAALADPEIRNRYAQDNFGDKIYYPCIAFAALHADNPTPYREFLFQWMQGGGWQRLYQTVTANPAFWSGKNAFLLNNVPGSFFWNNWAPYVTHALGKDTLWDATIAEKYDRYEKEGRPVSQAPLSWQIEFDGIKELAPYLAPHQPWKQNSTPATPCP